MILTWVVTLLEILINLLTVYYLWIANLVDGPWEKVFMLRRQTLENSVCTYYYLGKIFTFRIHIWYRLKFKF